MLADAGDGVEEGGAGDAGVDFGVGGAGDVDEGGDAGVREEADEFEEDFFAAAHAGEPVVDKPCAGGEHGGYDRGVRGQGTGVRTKEREG